MFLAFGRGLCGFYLWFWAYEVSGFNALQLYNDFIICICIFYPIYTLSFIIFYQFPFVLFCFLESRPFGVLWQEKEKEKGRCNGAFPVRPFLGSYLSFSFFSPQSYNLLFLVLSSIKPFHFFLTLTLALGSHTFFGHYHASQNQPHNAPLPFSHAKHPPPN